MSLNLCKSAEAQSSPHSKAVCEGDSEPVQASENAVEEDDSASIDTICRGDNDPSPRNLEPLRSQVSHTYDAPIQPYSSNIEIPDEVYDRLPPSKKTAVVVLLSFCSFLAPMSSTTILSAVPEVAATYNSTGTIINLSNALYMLFMGVSPILWGPFSQVYGRRLVRFSISLLLLLVPRYITSRTLHLTDIS
jgi:hypothetical protein